MKAQLSQSRMHRLKQNSYILGEPDLIAITYLKNSISFFGKEKEIQESTEFLISGLVFATTAHLSSFFSDFYGKKNKNCRIKAKYYCFDIFNGFDIQVEVNIPGSLQILAYGPDGKQTKGTTQMFQAAYLSSFLRGLHMMNCKKVILYPFVFTRDVLTVFIATYVPFCLKNPINNNGILQNQKFSTNLGLDILFRWILDNNFYQVGKFTIKILNDNNSPRALELKLSIALQQGFCQQLINYTSKLLHQEIIDSTKYMEIYYCFSFQIRALAKLHRTQDISQLYGHFLHQGYSDINTWVAILGCFCETKDSTSFLKIINTILTLHNEEFHQFEQIKMVRDNEETVDLRYFPQQKFKVSELQWLCFDFGIQFLNRQKRVIYFRSILNEANQNNLLGILDRLDQAIRINPLFYDLLVKFEKEVGWTHLIQCRGECFWLQSDYIQQGDRKKIKTNSAQVTKQQEVRINTYLQEELKDKTNYSQEVVRADMEKSFTGTLSENQIEAQSITQVALCSRRITRALQSMQKTKIICNPSLEDLFLLLYQDLKLQRQMEKWEQKLNLVTVSQLSKQKKELYSIIMLKKALLHKKLLRFRKCQDTVKAAKKLFPTPLMDLYCNYILLQVYRLNKNVKGVFYYLLQIIKVLGAMGVKEYDIVPKWVQPALAFILSLQGPTILKKTSGKLREIIKLWLRSQYKESQLSKIQEEG